MSSTVVGFRWVALFGLVVMLASGVSARYYGDEVQDPTARAHLLEADTLIRWLMVKLEESRDRRDMLMNHCIDRRLRRANAKRRQLQRHGLKADSARRLGEERAAVQALKAVAIVAQDIEYLRNESLSCASSEEETLVRTLKPEDPQFDPSSGQATADADPFSDTDPPEVTLPPPLSPVY